MGIKELLKKLKEDDSLYLSAKLSIKRAIFIIEIIDRYLNGDIKIRKVYSLSDFLDFKTTYNFKFKFIKRKNFIKIIIFDDEFCGGVECKFKDKYIYFENSDVALYLNEYMTNKGLINVKKKYLDVLENVRKDIKGWMSSRLMEVSYVMKEGLKDAKDCYLFERFWANIDDVIDNVFEYRVRSFEEYIMKKTNHVLGIDDGIDALMYYKFYDLESKQDVLTDTLNIEKEVNSIKELLELNIFRNELLMNRYFERVIVPGYLLKKHINDKERLNCIIKFNLIMQEIYREINFCSMKANFNWYFLRMNSEEHKIKIEHVKIREEVNSIVNFLGTDIYWEFKYIVFAPGVMKFSINNLYPFSICDYDDTKIYELTEERINQLISLRERINLGGLVFI